MGWQKRSVGNNYNSNSGHALMVGCHTNKVLMRKVYSKKCKHCKVQWKKQNLPREVTNKNDPSGEITPNNTPTHRCPKNYKGTAKSMEACAVVSMVTEMYDAGKNVIDVLLTDDDSTTRSNARHSFQEVMTANGWTEKEKAELWPKKKGGKYVADRGKLPIRVRAISKYLADPPHRGKSVGRAFYKLEGKRGRELKFTAVDCERLKRNFNFWHRQNRGEPYEVFEARYHAVIDHHFGDHSSCQSKEEGGWCKYKGHPELIAEARKQNRYHNKQSDAMLYQLVLIIWQHFGTDLMLGQVYHKFMSQKSKSLHQQQISHVAPKDKHFSSSMALSDRVALVVITDSVGYEVGVSKIFQELGVDLPPVTVQYLACRNRR